MKYFVTHAIVVTFMITVVSLLVWWVGSDTFNLSYSESVSLTIIGSLVLQLNDGINGSYQEMQRTKARDKLTEQIRAEMSKAAEKSVEQIRLEKYRKSFGQNQGDLN